MLPEKARRLAGRRLSYHASPECSTTALGAPLFLVIHPAHGLALAGWAVRGASLTDPLMPATEAFVLRSGPRFFGPHRRSESAELGQSSRIGDPGVGGWAEAAAEICPASSAA